MNSIYQVINTKTNKVVYETECIGRVRLAYSQFEEFAEQENNGNTFDIVEAALNNASS